jgi:hypothetical protein
MNTGYLDEVITKSQAIKKMKAAGYQYGQPDFWAEWNQCYAWSEDGLVEKREPRQKVSQTLREGKSNDLPEVGAHMRSSTLEGGFHTGSPDVT